MNFHKVLREKKTHCKRKEGIRSKSQPNEEKTIPHIQSYSATTVARIAVQRADRWRGWREGREMERRKQEKREKDMGMKNRNSREDLKIPVFSEKRNYPTCY